MHHQFCQISVEVWHDKSFVMRRRLKSVTARDTANESGEMYERDATVPLIGNKSDSIAQT